MQAPCPILRPCMPCLPYLPIGQRAGGFTLVEVLVSLAIVAIALAAGARATGALVANAERRTDVVFAQLCAENALAAVRLAAQLPPIGAKESTCEQAGRAYRVRLAASATVNPSLRRVDAQVSTERYFVLSLSTLVGRF